MENKKVHNFQFIVFIIVMMAIGAIVYFVLSQKSNTQIEANQSTLDVNSLTPPPSVIPSDLPSSTLKSSSTSYNQTVIFEPIDRALDRVTKKPFGIKISPKDSPISPERFSGYHTGVDFETFSDEQNTDVPIFAICSGPLAIKKYASGYGGVAVQLCNINNEDVMVIYGHLRLSSIAAKVNQTLGYGEQIGILGKGYSAETDGERKHLHLGIHRGKDIVLLGYVKIPQGLNSWIDAMALLK